MTDSPAGSASWQPTASLATLRRRAESLAATRDFFRARQVMEVETPALIQAPVSDVNLGSFGIVSADTSCAARFLHTSPEYAMKRLLAAGSGDIYQICHVFREAERGRLHNPEFTLVEWYRLGFSLEQLMQEVAELVCGLLDQHLPVERLSYREAVRRHAGVDPLEADVDTLRGSAQMLGLDPVRARAAGRDELLDLIVGAQVGPALGDGTLTFLHRYPASQAALARLDPQDPRLALRFELYHQGMELANGYHELADPAEQRARFEADQQSRQARGLPVAALDPQLLAALEAGLPDCAGVALGFDRVLMLATNAARIDEVLAFPSERA